MELFDHWSRQQAVLGARPVKKNDLPKPVRIQRPGQEQEQKKVETDPHVIAAFFRRHMK